jgi:transcription elongation GreA/GreB family factor
MDPGMALTVYRTVDRLQGLGQVVHSSLLRIIREAYPQAFAKLKTDPWLDDNIIFCTAQGMQKCENEINYLVNVKIPENAKAIGEAAAHGDLSENSEFRFALEERDLLQARLLRMQEERSRVRLLTANDIDTSAVNVGTKVTLVPTTGGQSRALTIIGPWEADMDKRIYNYRAPLCVRLKGLAIGDAVKLDLDGGECEYRIQAIENALG